MKRALVAFTVLVFVAPVLAQRPSDPALLVPESAPELDYVVAPTPVSLPDGVTMGASASVAFDANGHLYVLTRGDKAFFEFDRDGKFIRAFGDKLFTRAHGLRIDREGNLWATDVGAHVVMKMNRDGQTILTMPRCAVLRSFCLNHLIHHRAQLGVYLRLNNIPVPSVYGPSADEGTLG